MNYEHEQLHDVAQEIATGARLIAGIAAEQSANVLTGVRALGGIALARHIDEAPEYQTWGTAAAFFALAITDGEGALARYGRKLLFKDESKNRPLNAYADQLADKVLVDGALTAIALREYKNGSSLYGNTVGLAAGVTVVRDAVTTIDRLIADRQGIDTRAQKAGKNKAAIQYIATGFALSPLAKTPFGKALAGIGIGYSAKASVSSGISLHKSFKSQRTKKSR